MPDGVLETPLQVFRARRVSRPCRARSLRGPVGSKTLTLGPRGYGPPADRPTASDLLFPRPKGVLRGTEGAGPGRPCTTGGWVTSPCGSAPRVPYLDRSATSTAEGVEWIDSARARRGTWLLLATRILRGLAAGLLTIAFPYLVLQDLRTGAFLLGLLYAGGALSTAALSFGFGRLGSRSALRATYLVSLGLLPIACALLLLPPTLPLAALASVLGGFSATGSLAGGGVGGVAMPLQTAILSDFLPASTRTGWFSIFTFVVGVSAAMGAFAAGFGALEQLFGVALVLSTASVAVAVAVPVRSHPRGRRPSAASRGVIRRFAATGLLNGFSQGLLTPFLIPFFVLIFGIDRPQMATYTTASSLVGTFSVLAAPFLEARWGWVIAVVWTRGVAAGLAAVMPFVPLVPALAMYIALPAFRVMALPAQQSAMMGRLPQSDRSEGAGTNQAARVGAASGATAFGGFALEEIAAPVPFLGYAAALVANGYLYARFFGWHGERIREVRGEALAE